MRKFPSLSVGLFATLGWTILSGCGSSDAQPSRSNALAPPLLENPNAVCSQLDFHSYPWPQNTFPFETEGFQIAMNISSTFEGHDQWKNITNNFDGQGLSMGLLNQTLGTSSLQPLLIKIRKQHFDVLEKSFSSTHLRSLLSMLKKWESLKGSSSTPISRYDIGSEDPIYSNSAGSESVRWAKETLYRSNGDFIPSWKQELQNLISAPEYVRIQIDAAWMLHKKTLQLVQLSQVFQLRTYLLMFDFVVQNGDIYSNDWLDYEDFLEKSPTATDTEKLEKIVNLRLRWVKPQYVKIVRLRKMSLIHGYGRVNGIEREYEKEFCFNRMYPII